MRRATRCSISSRSSRLNSGSAFCGLRSVATTTSSKSRPARSTTSRWPLWNGSNEPGKRAMVTRCLSDRRPDRGTDHGHERTAVALVPDDLPARGHLDGPVRTPARPGRRGGGRAGVPGGEGVGGVAQREVERGAGRATRRTSARTTWARSGSSPDMARLPPDGRTSGRGASRRTRPRRAPRQGLDAHGPAAGEQVGDRHPLQVHEAPQHVEDRLPHPVRGGPGDLAGRCPQGPAPAAAGDHTHERQRSGAGLLPSSGRRLRASAPGVTSGRSQLLSKTRPRPRPRTAGPRRPGAAPGRATGPRPAATRPRLGPPPPEAGRHAAATPASSRCGPSGACPGWCPRPAARGRPRPARTRRWCFSRASRRRAASGDEASASR